MVRGDQAFQIVLEISGPPLKRAVPRLERAAQGFLQLERWRWDVSLALDTNAMPYLSTAMPHPRISTTYRML